MTVLQQFARGVEIYVSLYPSGYICAEHDIIYFADMVDEDNSHGLEELGFHFDDHCWARFI